jgi:anti-sigma factor RsiW
MTEPETICRRVGENLSAYLDGELQGAARREVEAHLKVCAACRKELADLEATWQLLDDLEAPIVPRTFQSQVVARAAAEAAESPWRRAWRRSGVRRAVAGAAAAGAAALFLAGLCQAMRPAGDLPTAAEAACIRHLDFLQNVRALEYMDKVKAFREMGGQIVEPLTTDDQDAGAETSHDL